jgi:hypothetical protein
MIPASHRNIGCSIARGVPTFLIDDEIFWGHDVATVVLDYLGDPKVFKDYELTRMESLPIDVVRRTSCSWV